MVTQQTLMGLIVAGVLIVGLAIVLSVGTDISHDVREQVRVLTNSTNESVTISGGTGTLTYGYVVSLSNCNNKTHNFNLSCGGTSLTGCCNISTSYADDSPSVVISFETPDGYTTPVNVTYDYDNMELASMVARNSSYGLANISKWQPTMGTVIVAGAIIGLIMTVFVGAVVGQRKRRGGL